MRRMWIVLSVNIIKAVVGAFLLIWAANIALAAPIRLRDSAIEPPAKALAIQDNKALTLQGSNAAAKQVYFIIQFTGPVQDDWKKSIQSLGISLGDYIPDYCFTAKANPSQIKDALGLEYVRWVQRITPDNRINRKLKELKRANLHVLIKLFPGESIHEVERSVRDLGGKLFLNKGNADGYLRAIVPTKAVDSIKNIEGVE